MNILPEISVIVPVYNVETSICRCLDSILAQTCINFELILVDDGSTDFGGSICDDYAEKYINITVIHTPNQGQGAARNVGIEAAKGQYILFCDADDCYDSDALKQFLDKVGYPDEKTLYAFDFRNVYPDHIDETGRYGVSAVECSILSEKIKFLSCNRSHDMVGYSIWNKLYSRDILIKYRIRFPERDVMNNHDDWSEDLMFNLIYFTCIDQIKNTGIMVYLLSKHGVPEEQNEDGLVGRIDYMIKMLLYAQNSIISAHGEKWRYTFWKIAVWHLKRYFYLDVRAIGVSALRKECMASENWSELINWIVLAQKNWKEYENRWDKQQARDYYYLLDYIKNGNLLKYKIRNKLLWR